MSIERLFKRKTSSKTRKTLERRSTDEQELLGVCIVLTEKVEKPRDMSFGEFLKRIREKYERLTGNRRITVIVP